MSEQVTVSARINKETKENFQEYVYKREDKIRGKYGEYVEKAMKEYMDQDRFSRIEDKLDQTLQKLNRRERDTSNNQSEPSTEAMEKTKQITHQAKQEHESTVHEADLDKYIELYAGASGKTKKKYRRLIRNHGFLFQHPTKKDKYFVKPGDYVQTVEQLHENGVIMTQKYSDLVNEFASNDLNWNDYKEETQDKTFQ